MWRNRFLLVAHGSILIGLTIYFGWFADRAAFGPLLGAYGLFFAVYLCVLFYRQWTPREVYVLTGLGIVLRVILLFHLPLLSDDFYRFLWDGRLAAQGIHPFAYPPVYFIENQINIPGITPELFGRLNSPEYYTVYPPVCQAVFWLAAKLFPESISGGVFILKLFLLGCEGGTIWLLGRGPFAGNPALAYALNPLILIEIVGNCHFEGAMLCFLLAGIYALLRGRWTGAALWWALATASKLLPLLFLPVVLAWLGWRRGFRFMVYFSAFCLILFWPLLDIQVMQNMAGSLNLYFRQFEFNASIYYLLKLAGTAVAPPKMDVARTLGPVLACAVFMGVAILALYRRPTAENPEKGYFLPNRLLFALMLYLTLATTVHPWYVAPLFGLGLLTRYTFPLAWTAVAVLSYSHYAGGGYQEHFGWIGMEYLIVFGAHSFPSPTK
ncbi:MAG: hypothetical protein L6Q97_02065 [Thermoanaerobaculia bacterium]|nr:hypothetical protein [Thermoanaerobaculia bacterium]